MKKRKGIHLVGITLVVTLFVSGCAVAGIKKGLVPQCPEGSWSRITENNALYRCEFVCGDNTVQVRYVPMNTIGFIGPPLLPLIPLSVKEPEKLLFDIHLMNKNGELPPDALSIQVKLPSDSQPHLPIRVVNLQRNIGAMKEEEMYHIDVLIGGRDSLFRTYLYKFDIDRGSIGEFEIIFVSDFNGCSIPSIRYEIKSKPLYKPLVPPGG